MKTILLVIAFSLAATAPQKPEIKLEIGSVLSKTLIPKKQNNEWVTHPAQTRPYIERQIDGVKYVIAYKKESRRIVYIFTSDEHFKTNDGLNVGLQIDLTSEQISRYPGWEIRGPKTADGWYPVIGWDIGLDLMNPVSKESFEPGKTVRMRIEGFSKGGN